MDLELDYNDDFFLCGKISEDYGVTLENRKRAPPTKIGDGVRELQCAPEPLIPDSKYFFQVASTAFQYDTYVNTKGYCLPYHCPLLVKIHSPEFQSTDLNGYYVLNYPPTFQSKQSNYLRGDPTSFGQKLFTRKSQIRGIRIL